MICDQRCPSSVLIQMLSRVWIFFVQTDVWILSGQDQNQIRVWTRSGQNSDFVSWNWKIEKNFFFLLFQFFIFSNFHFSNFQYCFFLILSRLGPDWSLVPDKNLDMKKSRLWTKSRPLSVIDNSGHDSEAFPETISRYWKKFPEKPLSHDQSCPSSIRVQILSRV